MAEAKKVDNDSRSETTFWEEYAGHFSGVRFKFRVDQYFAIQPSCDEVYFDKVIYCEDMLPQLDFLPANKVKNLNNQIMQPEFLEKLFYKKAERFHEEYEYRLVSQLEHTEALSIDDGYKYFFKFCKDNLLGVDIGINADPTIANELRQELSQFHIPVRTASVTGASSVQYR